MFIKIVYGVYLGLLNMKTCKLCLSPNRVEYEEMRFKKNKSIKEIWTYASSVKGENINYYVFQRHFYKMMDGLDAVHKSSKLRNDIIEEEIKKDIEISQRLRRNLEICADNIEKYAKRDDLTVEEEKSLLDFIGKTSLIIDELLKWSKQLDFKPKSEDIFEKILYCIHDFPEHLIEKFKERWSSYGSSS